MKRNDLSVREMNSIGQLLSYDHQDKIKVFREKLMAEAANIPDYNLGNFDEIPVPFDVAGSRTIDVNEK